MSRRILLPLLFITCSVLGFGQLEETQKQLQGQWTFHEVAESAELDRESMKMTHMMFGQLRLLIGDNMRYRLELMGNPDEGSYGLSNAHTLDLISDRGEEISLEFYILEEQTEEGLPLMYINMKGAELVLKRETNPFIIEIVEDEEDMPPLDMGNMDEIEPVVVEEAKAVRAEKEQLMKTWYLKDKTSSRTLDEKTKEVVHALMQSTSMELKKNGKYLIEVLGIKEKGQWLLDENSTVLVTATKDMRKRWYIQKITETELHLKSGRVGDIWMYTTEEPTEK